MVSKCVNLSQGKTAMTSSSSSLSTSSSSSAAAARSLHRTSDDDESRSRLQPPPVKRLRQAKHAPVHATAARGASAAAAAVASKAAVIPSATVSSNIFCTREPCPCRPICFPQTSISTTSISTALAAASSSAPSIGGSRTHVEVSHPATNARLRQWASSFPLVWRPFTNSSYPYSVRDVEISATAETLSTRDCFDLVLRQRRAFTRIHPPPLPFKPHIYVLRSRKSRAVPVAHHC